MWFRLGFAAALGSVAVACCPIPIPRNVTVRPQLSIDVVDAQGAPVAGADLTVRRFIANPGPETLMDEWQARTSADGGASLSEIIKSEPSLPLMMHGVNWYGWEACATHPDHPDGCARYDARQPLESPQSLHIQMGVGSPLLLETMP